MANPYAKTRPVNDPYEIWESANGQWKWHVLKKYKSPEAEAKDPYARWFCMVYTPFCPDGEMGDVYAREIKSQARLVKTSTPKLLHNPSSARVTVVQTEEDRYWVYVWNNIAWKQIGRWNSRKDAVQIALRIAEALRLFGISVPEVTVEVE